MTVPFIIGRDMITVMVDGVTHTVSSDAPNYTKLKEAIRTKDWEAIPGLVTIAKSIESFGNGSIVVQDGKVLYNGEELHNAVTGRIIEMVNEGFDASPLINFLSKLMANPSATAVRELYDWLAGTKLPITEDGDFIAYKKVREDFKDFYTGKVLNKPAELMTDQELAQMPQNVGGVTTEVVDGYTVLSMPRNQVDDNRDRTCSQGLHFCSLSYLPNYYGGRGRVLLVRINPADVVSIPSDYDFAKGRAWRYTVIGEHKAGELTEAFDTPVVSNTGEARTGARKQNAQNRVNTQVLGVDFGTEARAVQVQRLLDMASAQSTHVVGDTPDRARVHGFDDAWDDRQPSLHRFVGSNLRDAVAYAQGYYEGYDRCRGKVDELFTPAVVAASATTQPVMGNPSLVGYNQGRRDRARGVAFGAGGNPYQGDAARKYDSSYAKGYDSLY